MSEVSPTELRVPGAPPMPEVLHTPRLTLRMPRPEDAAAQVAAVHASLPELNAWMAWSHEPHTLDHARANLERAQAAYRRGENLRLIIWNRDETEMLGSTGYHALNWAVPKAEIGYWIATPHTGRGYALEAARFLSEYGLDTLGLRRIEIRTDTLNERSARIPRQLGYTLDATFRNDDVAADGSGRLRDTFVFSVTRQAPP